MQQFSFITTVSETTLPLTPSHMLNHYFTENAQYQQWKFVFGKGQDCNA
jgi:hypothetical protein